tara:strand:+ start:299 stop:892 length:594 start_codon:yes stop_codon:yes gene_type:complete
MLEKDKFLKKINYLVVFLIICLSKNLFAENIISKLKNYNIKLNNSSAHFIQTNGKTIEEGLIYFGNKRIRIDYNKPVKLTLVMSESKGMYTNHELKESQFFNTNKSYVKFFFKIFDKKNDLNSVNIDSKADKIIISENLTLNNANYKIKIIYENNPVTLRRIRIESDGESLSIGFFNHNLEKSFEKKFFSMIDPYLL